MIRTDRRPRRARALALLAALTICTAPLCTAPAAAAAPPLGTAPMEVEPLPGQSDQPAPASGEKRVIENVHTDTVSAFVDDGLLVLDSKADVDGELGKRFDAGATLFHLGEAGRGAVPANPAFGFLGAPGQEIWIAPQLRDPAVIWPGFSTEHPSLRAAAEGQWLSVRMLEVVGPGSLEVYLIGSEGVERLFSSTTALPDWQIEVPQHAHMNWAFSTPGTYTVSFEMAGLVGGAMQTARRDYTFVVGDLAAHTVASGTTLEADVTAIDPSDPVTLTARVSPAAVGAVQFRELVSGRILGHTPVGADGGGAFRTGALPPGEHRIVAEFVPTWSNDFAPSQSEPVVVTVSGEQASRPDHDDTEPVGEEALAGTTAGEGARVTGEAKTASAGAALAARVDAAELHGDWVSVWLHGSTAVWLGWVRLDGAGDFTASIPADTPAGEYRLVVKDRDGALVGWDRFTVLAPPGPVDPGPPPPTEPPPPAPTAPQQECLPAVTLEHGHIDTFAVSAGGGMAVLQLLEDVTGHRVLREAETVLLRVKEQAFTSIPAGVPGGPSGYLLPLAQNPNLIWPGWDTNRTTASRYSDVSINITGVSGPGQVHLYTSQGAFGGWRPILTHGGYTLPGTIREPAPAHTHAQWVFTQPGIYVLTVHAVATNPATGASLTTAEHSYVFQVGDVPLGDVFCGMSAHGAGASALVDAAVAQANLDAMATEQAAAADQERRPESSRSGTRSSADVRDPSAVTGIAATHPAVVAAIVGGGLLAIAGIAGGTVWVLRRESAGG